MSVNTAEATSYQAPEVPASPVVDDMDGYDWLEDIDKNKDVYRLKVCGLLVKLVHCLVNLLSNAD